MYTYTDAGQAVVSQRINIWFLPHKQCFQLSTAGVG
uniref:Uncharacterized protein n=1 Tax=Arundo donax TaxID=35708 RepID=A0A0A9C926_ARUDO